MNLTMTFTAVTQSKVPEVLTSAVITLFMSEEESGE